MKIAAPAKINLHLRVAPPRADGFHPLLSWMCTVGLFDELTFEKSPQTTLTCDDATIPTGAENLVVKAAAGLGVCATIHLKKTIPAGGGLAGGSSDAVATLIGLNQLYGLGRSREQLLELARRLGSDVSFFLHAPSAICTGLGEIARPIPPPAPRWALLVLPPFSMPTPAVYRRFDELKLGSAAAIDDEPDWTKWAALPALEFLPLLVNDLEAAAFDMNPALGSLRDRWEERLSRPVRMSGSGSTLFTLYDDQSQAQGALALGAGSSAEKLLMVGVAPGAYG